MPCDKTDKYKTYGSIAAFGLAGVAVDSIGKIAEKRTKTSPLTLLEFSVGLVAMGCAMSMIEFLRRNPTQQKDAMSFEHSSQNGNICR